jgi:hypothetical protein
MRPIAACCLFLLCVLSGVSPSLRAADPASAPYVDIERRLTPEQRHATGLDTLSPEQLALLNRLLRDQQGQVVEEARAQGRADAEVEAAAQRRQAAAVGPARGASRSAGLDEGPIRARLVGDLAGWQPGDVFVLDNGQQWQVLKGSVRLPSPRRAPDVRLVPGVAGRWFLEVDEDLPKARVYRID